METVHVVNTGSGVKSCFITIQLTKNQLQMQVAPVILQMRENCLMPILKKINCWSNLQMDDFFFLSGSGKIHCSRKLILAFSLHNT